MIFLICNEYRLQRQQNRYSCYPRRQHHTVDWERRVGRKLVPKRDIIHEGTHPTHS